MRRTLLGVAVTMLGISSCYVATGGISFNTTPIHVRAIDAVTQRPVAGAVLVAQWRTSSFLCIEGDCPRTIVRTAEAVTDRSGIAQIPPATVRRPGWEMLHADQPRVAVYKAGYVGDPIRHGTCLLIPPTSSADAAKTAQAMGAILGPDLDQWSPDRFPLLAAEVRKTQP